MHASERPTNVTNVTMMWLVCLSMEPKKEVHGMQVL